MKAVSTKAQKEQGGDILVTPTANKIAEAIAKRQSVMSVAMDVGYTKIAQELPQILDAVIDKAKGGNMTAAKLLLDRILPPQQLGDGTSSDKSVHVNITVTSTDPKPKGDIFDASPTEGYSVK